MRANFLLIFLQVADTVAVDTTSNLYRIGYKIGSFIPFIVIVILFGFYIRSTHSFRKKK